MLIGPISICRTTLRGFIVDEGWALTMVFILLFLFIVTGKTVGVLFIARFASWFLFHFISFLLLSFPLFDAIFLGTVTRTVRVAGVRQRFAWRRSAAWQWRWWTRAATAMLAAVFTFLWCLEFATTCSMKGRLFQSAMMRVLVDNVLCILHPLFPSLLVTMKLALSGLQFHSCVSWVLPSHLWVLFTKSLILPFAQQSLASCLSHLRPNSFKSAFNLKFSTMMQLCLVLQTFLSYKVVFVLSSSNLVTLLAAQSFVIW